MVKYIDPSEYIKRLAAAQGIETLNLVKTEEAVQGEMEQQQGQMAQQMEMTKQAGQFANAEVKANRNRPKRRRSLKATEPARKPGQPVSKRTPPEAIVFLDLN